MALREQLTRRKLVKWGKRLALAFVLFLALFMIASNVMLRTRAFRDLMAFDPESMTMDYDSAYSWFPGRVHVENLRIRGSDSHVQWRITIARADTFLNPFAFAERRFSASHATAQGITFHVRTRFLPDEATPELVAALPKIPGFADPPLAMPVPPDPADADYRLWSVDLEDVTALDITDVWIDTMRERGHLSARGRWLFRPLRELDFGPSTLEIPSADIQNRGRELAENVTGTATLRIFPYDVRAPQGFDLLRQFSGDVKLAWRTPLSDAFADLVGDVAKVHGGVVDVAGEMRIERGVLSTGTRAHADVDSLDASLAGPRLSTRASARADFVVDESGLFSGKLSSDDVRLVKGGAPAATIASTFAEITSRHLDLAHGFDDAVLELRFGGVETESIERWVASKDDEPSWATGAARVDADLETQLADPDFHGHVDAVIHDAAALAGPVRAMSEIDVSAEVAHLSPKKERIAASVEAKTPEPVLTALGDLRLRSLVRAHASVDARLADPKAIEIANGEMKWIDARADLNGKPLFVAPEVAVTASGLVVRGDHLGGRVAVDAPRIELASLAALASLAPFPESTRIVGGTATADAHGTIDLETLAAEGTADLLARDVDVRIDETPFYGNLQLGVHASRRGDGADFAGTTLVFARGSGAHAPPGAEPWSATFTLPEARLTRAGGPAIYAKVRGVATDATPATMFVSSATGVPGWITNLFRMRGLRVTGEVVAAPSFFAVRSLDARGDDSFVELEYSRRGAMKDGAIYLGKGIVTGGIDLAGGSARLVPIGAQSWFLRDVEKIRANEISLP